jgi:NADPH:quinone reductase-like Zn-dependent oxidoreductase
MTYEKREQKNEYRAGEVEEVGPQVQHIKRGDLVMALLAGGGYAECA